MSAFDAALLLTPYVPHLFLTKFIIGHKTGTDKPFKTFCSLFVYYAG